MFFAQIIVCENGSAGVNFEHSHLDGHTVLRFASDVFTDTILCVSVPRLHAALTCVHLVLIVCTCCCVVDADALLKRLEARCHR